MVQNSHESRHNYRATCSSVRSFAHTTHSFAHTAHSFVFSTLLAFARALCTAHLFACLLPLCLWDSALVQTIFTSALSSSSFSFSRNALWSGTNKNRDVSNGPLARPFACWLVLLTHSLALDCSLRSRPLLLSVVRLLAHIARSHRSLPCLWESE